MPASHQVPATSSPLLQGLPAVISPQTRLLILGSFPGVASLAAQQYYGHPRNQFWPLVGAIWGLGLADMPYTQRVAWVQLRGLGLWDIYARCRRIGSLDSAIQDAELNDLASLQHLAPGLVWVAHNGAESARSMRHLHALGLTVQRLPSSSPANATWSFAQKLAAWRLVFERAGLV